jgi:hypothetical protein
MFHTIIVFSPTVASDEKWDYIKKKKLLVENIPLKEWIKQQSRPPRENQVVQKMSAASEFEGLVADRDPDFDGIVPENCFFEDYDEEVLRDIYEQQMQIVKLLKKHGKTKHLANRYYLLNQNFIGV